MFVDYILVKEDVILDVTREDHFSKFKTISENEIIEDRRKPIYKDGGKISRRIIGYEQKTITRHTFTLFDKGFKISFNPDITVIVGDNGCGKTTLLKQLHPPSTNVFFNTFNEDQKIDYLKKWVDGEEYKIQFRGDPEFIICEREIHKNSFTKNYANHKQYLKPDELINLWNMQSSSNGENVMDFLTSLKDIKNSLIILDEPETSLSIKSQLKVVDIIKQLIANKNQVIVIAHSIILIENLSDTVFDFEEKKYVLSKEYIKSQLSK